MRMLCPPAIRAPATSGQLFWGKGSKIRSFRFESKKYQLDAGNGQDQGEQAENGNRRQAAAAESGPGHATDDGNDRKEWHEGGHRLKAAEVAQKSRCGIGHDEQS